MRERSQNDLETFDESPLGKLPGRITESMAAGIQTQQGALLALEIDGLSSDVKMPCCLFRRPRPPFFGQEAFTFPDSSQTCSRKRILFCEGFDGLRLFERTHDYSQITALTGHLFDVVHVSA